MTARRLALMLGCLLGASEVLLPARGAFAAPPSGSEVAVYPIPGSRVASPQSQIAFRGVPLGGIGAVSVTGSKSGPHNGTLRADSDGRGGSFLPSAPFSAGETVTVTTSLNIRGASGGEFRFTVASPSGSIPFGHWPAAPRVRGDVLGFHSRPDLRPVAVRVTTRSLGQPPGDIFLAPWFGPLQDGPMILDPQGGLVWFDPLPDGQVASGLRVQRFLGRSVLTWWQGHISAGLGSGHAVMVDSSYRPVAAISAANGLPTDLHEFEITPWNTALVTSYLPLYWNASRIRGGSQKQIVLDSVVQEIDIPTGLLLFQWDSLDHVPVTDSYAPLPQRGTRNPYDYFHINSVDLDRDGTLIVSGRNTWTAYKVDRGSGGVIWRLGGKHSSFRLAPGTHWAFQHDVRVQASGDRFITLFDNESSTYKVRGESGALKLRLDLKHMTAQAVARHRHSPSALASFAGDLEQLPNGNDFVGWGAQPYFSEYGHRGRLLFDGRFVDANASYRAYVFPWSGEPDPASSPPQVATARRRGGLFLYASWNGATGVASWRAFGGAGATTLPSPG